MMTNSSLPRCPVPQLIHHRNLWAFESPREEVPEHAGVLKFYAIRASAKRALRAAAANVFVSNYLRRAAERILPDTDGRNHVVCNGLDESMFSKPSASTDTQRPPLICAVQPNNTQKDNTTLLRAFAELVRMAPDTEWRLLIAGGGDWERHRAFAASLGVLPQVQWAGHLDSTGVRNLYDKSHCLMFTSYFESFGNPPLEAMARGCPVIAVNTTAMPEVIGDAGILVSKGDCGAFAQAALTLWRDADARRRLVQLGFRRAAQFSWTRSADKLLAVMKGIRPAAQRAVVGV
jgi:glycosyltransferase involved in cell wall biosynthesis